MKYDAGEPFRVRAPIITLQAPKRLHLNTAGVSRPLVADGCERKRTELPLLRLSSELSGHSTSHPFPQKYRISILYASGRELHLFRQRTPQNVVPA